MGSLEAWLKTMRHPLGHGDVIEPFSPLSQESLTMNYKCTARLDVQVITLTARGFDESWTEWKVVYLSLGFTVWMLEPKAGGL